MATRQQIFDRALEHLRKQGKPAVVANEGGTICAYRTPNGLKCAVGCLIPDDKYDPDMEGITAAVFDIMNAIGLRYVYGNKTFIKDLQHFMHDRNRHSKNFLEDMENGAQTIAKTYNLKFQEK